VNSRVIRIAAEEWRSLARNRAGLIATLLLVALIVVSAMVSFERRAGIETERARYQAAVDDGFDHQPARHPHRMVHYGQFVFRPLSPLAFVDFGVDSFTGNTIFLEGHRQNSANFSEARQSSLLLRFGQLTPAFVLQVLAPLLLVFLAFASVARERERGILRLLLAQGVSGGQLLRGKLLGHGSIAIAIGTPAFLLLAWLAASAVAPWGAVALLIIGYAVWLVLWAMIAVLTSALVTRSRDALVVLIGLWMVGVILLPRALPELAATRAVLPSRIETEIALHRDLKQTGDAHDPGDPYFAAFKARTLARYGVSRIEDLPVQYAGLVAVEGERLTTALHARSANDIEARESAQNDFVRAFGMVSPLIAVRQLSMTLTGTGLAAHQDFLNQSEAFRYRFVQALNWMQAEKIPSVNAGEDPRVSADNWKTIPRFRYRPFVPPATLIWPNLLVLGGWLAGLLIASVPIARRLGRTSR
jgi:ABC-2 type transport system permease protein